MCDQSTAPHCSATLSADSAVCGAAVGAQCGTQSSRGGATAETHYQLGQHCDRLLPGFGWASDREHRGRAAGGTGRGADQTAEEDQGDSGSTAALLQPRY